MDTAGAESAFEACDAGLWAAFLQYVEAEVGAVGELEGMDEADIRTAVHEFFAQCSASDTSALKKGKCVKELQAAARAARDVKQASPSESPSAEPQHELRRRKGCDAGGSDAQKQQQQQQDPDEPKAKVAAREPTNEDFVKQLPFKHQVIFLLFKATLTLVIFSLLHYLAHDYIFSHQKDPPQPDIDAIVKRIQAEGSVVHQTADLYK